MKVRKEIRALTQTEKERFVSALLVLKKDGRYDTYVHQHHAAMKATVYEYEPQTSYYRNGAHRGPAFLPWHRAFLLQLEQDLQSISKDITIPYWNWTIDATLENPERSPLWAEDFMGGNGSEPEGWKVTTGAFAFKNGNWPIPLDQGGPALTRRFGSMPGIETLPTPYDLDLAKRETFYDSPPFSCTPFTVGFRNRIEGWVTKRGDPRVKTEGSQLHNRVHLWVGGQWEIDGKVQVGSMVPDTSPNDPVFFLNHCFIDKVWAEWQRIQGDNSYAPVTGGPLGHNLTDRLVPWNYTIKDLLSPGTLGYSYEDSSPVGFFAQEDKTESLRKFLRQTPFWAE